MKKANVLGLVSLIMALMMSFTFTSCGDDDDDDVNPSTGIVGTWQMTEFYDSEADEEEKAINDALAAASKATFNADGTGNYYMLGETTKFTYKLNGDKLTTTDEDGEAETWTVKVSSSKLVMEAKEDGETVRMSFKK